MLLELRAGRVFEPAFHVVALADPRKLGRAGQGSSMVSDGEVRARPAEVG
jgi:hypothetical protein